MRREEMDWKVKDHVTWRKKNQILVILDTISGHYYTLNQTAMDIWIGCVEEGKSLEKVMDEICAKYPGSPDIEQIRKDCQDIISYWVEEALIQQTS
jgi:Coenzyme PQQ synthesis protein D (PqqD)